MTTPTIHSPDTVHLRITMPEYPDVQMVMPFSSDDTVWNVKQGFLKNLKKDLVDGQNYGLYIPAASCRTGKFLDEERCLREYPLTGGIKYFEFKYKHRIKFNVEVSSMKLKKINTQVNQRDFLESVRRNDTEKVMKLLNKGLNPNYNNAASGETPLTLATKLNKPRMMIVTLVSGGTFIDYRNKHGSTPLHAAVLNKNKDALRTLLDLGSSPNYKDKDNLTALYVCCMSDYPLQLTSMLLHERAQLQGRDRDGCTELHHACRQGNTELVEQLVFYGADVNSQDHNGETPLHICANLNHDACCKVLMVRGADKSIKNNKQQTASSVAQTHSHSSLCRLIEDFKTSEIVYFDDLPVYNEKRRGLLSADTIRSLEKSRSNPNLHLLFANQFNPTSTISAASLNTLERHSKNHVRSNNSNPLSDYTANPNTENHTISPKDDINNHTNNHTRTRTDGQRQSAMELEWIADKKEETPKSVVKDPSRSDFEEISITLKKLPGKGFGFSIKNIEDMNEEHPCKQFFNEVYDGKGAADAGLRAGDYLFELNGKDLSEIDHETCVKTVKKAGSLMKIKVLRKIKIQKIEKVKDVSKAVLKPSEKENEDIFKNHALLNNTDIKKNMDETLTERPNNFLINNVDKKNQVTSKEEKNILNGSNEVDGSLASRPPSIPTPPPMTSAPLISNTKLQDTIPLPPPIPEFGTLKLSQPREVSSVVDSEKRDSQSNTLKAKDVVNSTINGAAHNDLLDAIKRRKQLVEDVGSDVLSASIESRVNKSKKLINVNRVSLNHEDKTKQKNVFSQNTSKHQSYGLLSSDEHSKTLGKQPKSQKFKNYSSNGVYSADEPPVKNQTPIFETKTLPKKMVNENVIETNGKKGFLEDAEKLRLMLLERKLNSSISLGPTNLDANNNDIKAEIEQKKEESLSNISKEDKKNVTKPVSESVSVFVEPGHADKKLESLMPPQNESNSFNNTNQNFNLLEEIKNAKISNVKKSPIVKPKLTLDTSLNNPRLSASPAIGLLANIVAEKAQEKQSLNKMIQEPSSGSSRIYSAGDSLKKNKDSPNTSSSKILLNKELLYTSQSSSEPPASSEISTKSNLIIDSVNKKINTSNAKTPASPPPKNLIFYSATDSQKSKIESSKLNSSKQPPINPHKFTKPSVSKPYSPNSNLSNQILNSSKSPPLTSPKTFLQNDKFNKNKILNSKHNEYSKSTETNQVLIITPNFTDNKKQPPNGGLTFYKNNSVAIDSRKKTIDFKSALNRPQALQKSVTTPPEAPASPETSFPTLRKKPQQSNTLIFKAKTHNN